MTEIPHYPNAPIVEAIFDIQVTLSEAFTQDEFAERAKRIVGEGYPICGNLGFQSIEFKQEADALNVRTNADWVGCEFKNSSQNQVVRIRKDGISFHRLRPYTSYDELIAEVQALWKGFLAQLPLKAITKLSLRFVNKINLPTGTKIGDLSEYVKVVPHVALPSEADIQNLLSRVHIKEKSTGNNAHVSFSSIQKDENLLGILLDIEAWNDRGSSAESDEIWDRFSSLRDLKNRLFTGSLEDQCLSLFK